MEIRKIREDEFQEASVLLKEMGKVEEEGFYDRFVEMVYSTDYLFAGLINEKKLSKKLRLLNYRGQFDEGK